MISGQLVRCLSVLILLSACSAGISGTLPRGGASVDPALVKTYFDRQGERGLDAVVVVFQGKETLHRAAYGRARDTPETPMTIDTLVDAGSIAKQFTATLVMQEVEAGRLQVSDPVSKFFPEAPADKQDITLHQLMTHTSGLTEHSKSDFDPMSKEKALENIFASELAFEPGADFTYSNSGYTLLAAILEQSTSQGFTDLVRARLFKKAGMTRAGFHGDAYLVNEPVASGYTNDDLQPSPVDALPMQWGLMGNGGVIASVDDLAKWMRKLSVGQVVSQASLAQMWTGHHQRREGVGYGYAWWIYDSPLGVEIWHGGTGSGGNSDMAYYPELDLVSIILSNRFEYRIDPETSQPVKAGLPAREARKALARAIAERDPSLDPEITLDRMPQSDK